ncbi:MAG: hypothetical protein ABJA67_12210 [Chthonomonadales bacterium]
MKKYISAVSMFAILLWTATAISPLVRAQQSGADAAQTLEDESLKTMLTNMGFEPKPLSKGFLLAIKQDTWTINMQVVLSPDKRKMGLNANLGKVDEPASITADKWLALLVSNGDIDPSAFYYDQTQKKLYLHRSFDNRAVTPAVLRKEVENFAANVRNTDKLWSFAK